MLIDQVIVTFCNVVVDKALEKVRNLGFIILLVEQPIGYALETVHCAYGLKNGEIVLKGLALDVLVSDMIKRDYIGL